MGIVAESSFPDRNFFNYPLRMEYFEWQATGTKMMASNTAFCDELDFEYDPIKLANSGVDGLNQGYRDGGTNKTTSPANRAEGQGVPR